MNNSMRPILALLMSAPIYYHVFTTENYLLLLAVVPLQSLAGLDFRMFKLKERI